MRNKKESISSVRSYARLEKDGMRDGEKGAGDSEKGIWLTKKRNKKANS